MPMTKRCRARGFSEFEFGGSEGQVSERGEFRRTTHAGAVGRGARMAANKGERNLRRRNAGSRRALGGHRGTTEITGRRTVDQPGPGRTGAANRTGAIARVWEFGEFGPLAVLEDCGGRARVGDSEGGRGLGRLGSFEHAA